MSDPNKFTMFAHEGTFTIFVPNVYQPFEVEPVLKMKSLEEALNLIDGRPFDFVCVNSPK